MDTVPHSQPQERWGKSRVRCSAPHSPRLRRAPQQRLSRPITPPRPPHSRVPLLLRRHPGTPNGVGVAPVRRGRGAAAPRWRRGPGPVPIPVPPLSAASRPSPRCRPRCRALLRRGAAGAAADLSLAAMAAVGAAGPAWVGLGRFGSGRAGLRRARP